MKILLFPMTETGGENPQLTATPPLAAETVANGKSEREAKLERENIALKKAAQRQLEHRKKVEVNNAHLKDENDRLKTGPATPTQPAKEKFSWMGYTQS